MPAPRSCPKRDAGLWVERCACYRERSRSIPGALMSRSKREGGGDRGGDMPDPRAHDDVAELLAQRHANKPKPKPRHELPTRGGPGVKIPAGQKYNGNKPDCALTDELFDAIVKHVRAGNFRTVAAQAEGVSLKTFHSWIHRGRGQIEEYTNKTREDLPIQAQLVLELERSEGLYFVTEHEKVSDELGEIRDRTLRFALLRGRFARHYSAPMEQVDDQAATTEKVDAYELLLARIAAIKAAYP